MRNEQLIEKHILTTGDNRLIFVFEPAKLPLDENGNFIINDNLMCIDFGKLLSNLDSDCSDEHGAEIIKKLLSLREEGNFEDFL